MSHRLTLRATGDRLQAVSRGLGVTEGHEVTMTQLQVPHHCPATASQRAAALHCLSDLVRLFRRSHGLWSGKGVGEWVISTTTGSEVTVRAAGMLQSCLRFGGRIRVQVSFSGQLLSLTPGGSNKPAHATAPSASDQTKSYFPCKTSVISEQPSRAQKLWKKSPKHKHCHNAAKLCMVPEMLLMYTLGRFVYAIYPLKDFSPWTEEVIEKRVELTWHLFLLVQEALAKAMKTRALQRALRRLSEPNQNHGPLELQLGDLLYSNFEKDFPSQRPLVPEAFMGDHQLCLEVSVMVSRVLLQHWTPRITFSPDCEVQDISPRLRRRSGSLTRHWSSMNNLSEVRFEHRNHIHAKINYCRKHMFLHH